MLPLPELKAPASAEAKTVLQKIDDGFERIFIKLLISLVNFNAYYIIGGLMLAMAAAIDLQPNSLFFHWVQTIQPWLAPALWKYAFILCAAVLYTAHEHHLGFWLFIFASPLLAVCYFFFRAIASGFIPNELFSYIALIWLFGVTTLFMLRSVFIDSMQKEIAQLRAELEKAQAKLKEASSSIGQSAVRDDASLEREGNNSE